MKKTIQILVISILTFIIAGVVIFFFNPLNLRNKIIGAAINYYFQIDKLENTGTINNTATAPTATTNVDKNPLLSAEQEKQLESFGVDVEALPKEVTPGMSECFIEKLGQERAMQIVGGATPTALEIFQTKDCLSK